MTFDAALAQNPADVLRVGDVAARLRPGQPADQTADGWHARQGDLAFREQIAHGIREIAPNRLTTLYANVILIVDPSSVADNPLCIQNNGLRRAQGTQLVRDDVPRI